VSYDVLEIYDAWSFFCVSYDVQEIYDAWSICDVLATCVGA
jgi:hypothetical protein